MKRIALCMIPLVLFSLQCKKKHETMLERSALVNFVVGEVFLSTGANKKQAAVGDAVTVGMKLTTGPAAMVELLLGDTVIKIMEKSVVELQKSVFNVPDNVKLTELYIEQGKVFSRITHRLAKGEVFTVLSPSTVAAVRGTEFIVEEEGGTGTVACLDGKVEVQSAQDTETPPVTLEAGQEAKLEPGKNPLVQAMKDENKRNLKAISEEIREAKKEILQKIQEEQQKIRDAVEQHRAEVKKMVEDTREQAKQDVEGIKTESAAGIEEMKKTSETVKEETKVQVDAVKQDTGALKDQTKSNVESVKAGSDVESVKSGSDVESVKQGFKKPL